MVASDECLRFENNRWHGATRTPRHARKRGLKYRYYISSALLQGRAGQAGTISRVPAAEIESLIVQTLRDQLERSEQIDDRGLIDTHVTRIEVQSAQLLIELTGAKPADRRQATSRNVCTTSGNLHKFCCTD